MNKRLVIEYDGKYSFSKDIINNNKTIKRDLIFTEEDSKKFINNLKNYEFEDIILTEVNNTIRLDNYEIVNLYFLDTEISNNVKNYNHISNVSLIVDGYSTYFTLEIY